MYVLIVPGSNLVALFRRKETRDDATWYVSGQRPKHSTRNMPPNVFSLLSNQQRRNILGLMKKGFEKQDGDLYPIFTALRKKRDEE